MTKRIFKSIFAVSLIVLATCTGVTLGILYHYFGNQLQKDRNQYATYGYEKNHADAAWLLRPEYQRTDA